MVDTDDLLMSGAQSGAAGFATCGREAFLAPDGRRRRLSRASLHSSTRLKRIDADAATSGQAREIRGARGAQPHTPSAKAERPSWMPYVR